MLVQVVTFNLKDFSDADYRRACEAQFAAVVAAQRGLVSKTWLANRDTNTYGGIYVWEHAAAIEAFARSDFYRAFGPPRTSRTAIVPAPGRNLPPPTTRASRRQGSSTPMPTSLAI